MRIEGTSDSVPPQNKQPPAIRVGRQYRFLVESTQNDHGVLRLPNGSVIKARLDGTFELGKWYEAVAVRKGLHIVLRQIPQRPEAVPEPTSDLGLPRDKLSQAIIRAFVREHLALDSRALNIVYRRLSRAPFERRHERARLAAILERKGLLESETLWSRLELIIDGPGGETDAHGQRQKDSGKRDGSPQDPHSYKKQLAKSVSASVMTTETPDDLLQLFNHVPADNEHWIIIPLRVARDESHHATLRIHVPNELLRQPAQRSIDYDFAVLDVREGRNEWTFAIQRADGGEKRMEISLLRQTGRSPSTAEERAFELALARLGASFTSRTTTDTDRVSDGFSRETSGDIIPNADIEA